MDNEQSEKQIKAAAKRRDALGKKLAGQLSRTADALNDYYLACCDAGDPVRHGDDARQLLWRDMNSYADMLARRHGVDL